MSGVRALAFMLNTLWLLDIDQGRIVLPLTDTVCFRISMRGDVFASLASARAR